MIIYLLTFYLFDDIEKKISESLMRIILLRQRQFWENKKNARATWTSIFSIRVLG